MKVSDYIVEFLINKGITDVFGYPGGMVTHLMNSFSQYDDKIQAHVNYHEQASAFAACGYAQIAMKPGIAYATSGPGATNLITGICNAYFDSIPAIFITGQVNTYESKGSLGVRQKGFQETDIISVVKSVTKYCVSINDEKDIKYELEKAYYIATHGRKGPVLLDIPMNVQCSDVNPGELKEYNQPNVKNKENNDTKFEEAVELLKNAKRPCILIGNGIKISNLKSKFNEFLKEISIPVVTSLLSFDVLSKEDSLNYGFIGAYGDRTANFILAKSDLVLAMGTRLDIRQVGAKVENFAINAKLIRFEIDEGELSNKIKPNEIQINCDVQKFFHYIINNNISVKSNEEWIGTCYEIKSKLAKFDDKEPNNYIEKISNFIPNNTVITTDVGQNQIWVAQSFKTKPRQTVLFSGGHGAMGYSLPAAIGAHYASKGMVVSFNGDGGFQMNIQELQFISREKLPIIIVIMNNKALGMIRHFQEMYFDCNYTQTKPEGGYTTPSFEKVATAYDLNYIRINSLDDVNAINLHITKPLVVEVMLKGNTYVFPKLEYGKPNQDQEPLIDRKLFKYLMDL